MHRMSTTSRLIDAVGKAVAAVQLAPSMKIAHDADALEALFGDESLEQVRGRILRADRAHRRDLYRLHDELARRRRPATIDRFAGAGA
ncbi:MAG TPA: hypothetical protein VG407_13165 [Caulobacteraceae bacterium]|nr:hypothetical protein [Caulobacteraceae bacterium]